MHVAAPVEYVVIPRLFYVQLILNTKFFSIVYKVLNVQHLDPRVDPSVKVSSSSRREQGRSLRLI